MGEHEKHPEDQTHFSVELRRHDGTLDFSNFSSRDELKRFMEEKSSVYGSYRIL